MTEPLPFVRRTYEPFRFLGKTLGRLFWVPLRTTPETVLFSYAPTWEVDGSHWGPTLVFRIPFTRRALGLGVWLDVDKDEIVVIRDLDAEYATYTAVNGKVDREQWEKARQTVAEQGFDPDEEMEMMQALGVFE